MTARFAGSRDLDDRRRRRLAQEFAPATAARTSPSKAEHLEPENSTAPSNTAYPTSSLIPRSPWIIGLVAMLGLLVWAAMLWMGTDPAWTNSAIGDVVSISSGRTTKFFSTVALLLTSQLCTMILWYRSKSRKDFSGRYRLWAWGSIFWSLMCLGVATGFHQPLAKMAYEYWKVECWRPETMYWLTPTASGFAALYSLLGREIRQSRTGLYFWNLCACLGALSLAVTVGLELSFPQSLRPAVNAGIVTLWHYSSVVAFLVHARFVVHVSNEAAPRRQRHANPWVAAYLNMIRRGVVLVRIPRIRVPGLRLPRLTWRGLKLPRLGVARPKLPTLRWPAVRWPGLPKIHLPKLRLPALSLPKLRGSKTVENATPATAEKVQAAPAKKPVSVVAEKSAHPAKPQVQATAAHSESAARKLRVDSPQAAPPVPKSEQARNVQPVATIRNERPAPGDQKAATRATHDDDSPLSRKNLRKLRRPERE